MFKYPIGSKVVIVLPGIYYMTTGTVVHQYHFPIMMNRMNDETNYGGTPSYNIWLDNPLRSSYVGSLNVYETSLKPIIDPLDIFKELIK